MYKQPTMSERQISSKFCTFPRALLLILTMAAFGVSRHTSFSSVFVSTTKNSCNGNGSAEKGAAECESINITKKPMHASKGHPDGNIRLLVTKGCSGSSFVISTLRKFLSAHGFRLRHTGNTEVYKPNKNPFFKEAKRSMPKGTSERDLVIAATVMLNQEEYEKNRSTLFKWKHSMLRDILEKMGSENVLVGSLIRKNVLDGLICSVRDCFLKGRKIGYPVFVNGSRTELCFSRRNVQNEKIMAYFRPEQLAMATADLQWMLDDNEMVEKHLDSETYEELTALEYTNEGDVVNASMRAWYNLVRNVVGNDIERGHVDNEIRHMINSRREDFHEDNVYNHDDLSLALRNAGLGDLIRSRNKVDSIEDQG